MPPGRRKTTHSDRLRGIPQGKVYIPKWAQFLRFGTPVFPTEKCTFRIANHGSSAGPRYSLGKSVHSQGVHSSVADSHFFCGKAPCSGLFFKTKNIFRWGSYKSFQIPIPYGGLRTIAWNWNPLPPPCNGDVARSRCAVQRLGGNTKGFLYPVLACLRD